MKRFLLLLLLIITGPLLLAQDAKREFEKSIKPTEAPARVQAFMDFFFPEVDKPRYYHESDGENDYYEVKFEWREMPLSVEFFPDGQLMDIEHLVAFNELPDSVQHKIRDYFEAKHQRHHINRVQIQYSGPAAINVIEGLLSNNFSKLTLRYELEADVAGNADAPFGAYEFLFDDEGQLLQMRPILKRSSDNVTY